MESSQITQSVGRRLMDGISRVVSWATLPCLMPTYAMIIVFHIALLSYTPDSVKIRFLLINLLATFVLPMAILLPMMLIGRIKEVGLRSKESRVLLYVLMSVAMLGMAYFLDMRKSPHWFSMYYAGCGATAAISMLINVRWKISAHTVGVSTILAMLLRLKDVDLPQQPMQWWIVGGILIAGLVGSCRIYLDRSQLSEVLVGYLVGYSVVTIVMML